MTTLEAWSGADLRSLLVSNGPIPGRRSWPPHALEHYVLWLLRAGSLHVEYVGASTDGPELAGPFRSVEMHSPVWILFPIGFSKGMSFSPDASLLSYHFLARLPDGSPLFSFPEPLVRPYDRWSRFDENLVRLAELHARRIKAMSFAEAAEYRAIEYAFLSEWAQEMEREGVHCREPRSLDERVVRAMRVLDTCGYRGTLPRQELERAAATSIVHLSRLFREAIGATPKAYLERRKQHRSQLLLSGTRKSVKEIAYDLGFPSEGQFCRWFKRRAGRTPGEYRESV